MRQRPWPTALLSIDSKSQKNIYLCLPEKLGLILFIEYHTDSVITLVSTLLWVLLALMREKTLTTSMSQKIYGFFTQAVSSMTAMFCSYCFVLLVLCAPAIALEHHIALQTYKHDSEQFKKVYKYPVQHEKHTTSLVLRKTKIKTTMGTTSH